MNPYIHEVDENIHSQFLSEGRKDPYTKALIKHGDKIVFCAGCKDAYLFDSWESMRGKHCNQTETLREFITEDVMKIRFGNVRELEAKIKKLNNVIITIIIFISWLFLFIVAYSSQQHKLIQELQEKNAKLGKENTQINQKNTEIENTVKSQTKTVKSLNSKLVDVIKNPKCYEPAISKNKELFLPVSAKLRFAIPTLNDPVNQLTQKLESVEKKLDCAIQEHNDLKTRINELEKYTYVKFCNNTSYSTIEAAFAYWDGTGLRSRGWFSVKSGECSEEVSVAQNYNGNVYVYGMYHRGEHEWGSGQYSFCVDIVYGFSISESDKVNCTGTNQKRVTMSAWSVSPGTNTWNLSQ